MAKFAAIELTKLNTITNPVLESERSAKLVA